jgi:hypothetical protein
MESCTVKLHIVIGFDNDNRQYYIPISIIQKYPLSTIYGYMESCGIHNVIVMHDMNYDEFGKLYDVIMGYTKQFDASADVISMLEHHGLLNDSVNIMQKNLKIKMTDELNEMTDFLNNQNVFFECKTEQDYFSYKEIFQYQKNIIPVQLICHSDATTGIKDIIGINIHDGIPLYVKHPSKGEFKIEYYEKTDIDINTMRHDGIILNMCVPNSPVGGYKGDKGECGNPGTRVVGPHGNTGPSGPLFDPSKEDFYGKNEIAYSKVLLKYLKLEHNYYKNSLKFYNIKNHNCTMEQFINFSVEEMIFIYNKIVNSDITNQLQNHIHIVNTYPYTNIASSSISLHCGFINMNS